MLPACPATTTILMRSLLPLTHSLTPPLQRPLSLSSCCTHTPTPLMTSMTSPLALARDETVTSNQLRCARGYHQSHSNHSHQPGQANRAARRHSGARALSSPLPFSILPTPSRRQRVEQTTSSCPKQASRPKHYRPQGYALLCLRLLNCPIPSHFQPNYITFFADRARRFRAQEHIH